MNCTYCGAPLRDGVAFCTNCGNKVTPAAAAPRGAACMICGAPIPAGMAFCTNCGTPVNTRPAAPSGVPCRTCGAIVPDGVAFCTTCGTPVNAAPAAPSGVPCRTCGAIVPDGVAFCTNCGTPVNAAPAAPSEPEPAPVQQQSFSQSAGFAAVPYPGKSGASACPVCGKTIPEGYAFCTGCGTPVGAAPAAEPAAPAEPAAEPPVVCWNCEALVPAGMRFCLSCGADMTGAAAPEPIPEPLPPEKKSRTGLWIALICVFLALIAGLAVAYFTGALDGVLGIDREKTEETDDRDDDADSGDSEDDKKADTSDKEDEEDEDKTSEEDKQDEEEEEEAETPEESPEPEPDYLLPDSQTRRLTEADLQNLSWRELCLARNEIFARHGLIFKTPEIREYFESKDWYEGRYTEVTLSDIETANVNLIVNYEQQHFKGSYY